MHRHQNESHLLLEIKLTNTDSYPTLSYSWLVWIEVLIQEEVTHTAPPKSRQYLTEGSCERKQPLKKFKYINFHWFYIYISWPIIISAVFQISIKCANTSLIVNGLENIWQVLRTKFENERGPDDEVIGHLLRLQTWDQDLLFFIH